MMNATEPNKQSHQLVRRIRCLLVLQAISPEYNLSIIKLLSIRDIDAICAVVCKHGPANYGAACVR
jgi:hypothetical protein